MLAFVSLARLASGDASMSDVLADDAPAIRLINGILAEAIRHGVSDVHVEPYESGLPATVGTAGSLSDSFEAISSPCDLL